MTLWRSIKAAFLNKWNLLFFSAGIAAAALSGPLFLVVSPLVLAAELAYLGFLGTHPKFQRYVAAQEAKAARGEGTVSAELTMRKLLDALPSSLVQRFENLRTRCLELSQLAQELRDPQAASQPMPLENLQLAGLDRLLWIYLRLLFTQYSLEKFLQKTSETQIEREVKDLERRLGELSKAGDDPQKQKLKKAVEDNLETTRNRLTNCRKAKDNHELVQVEIERLENKIRALSEMAVNRQEHDFIAGQVDQVVSGMVQTEQTMSELQFLTGLDTAREEVPEMLRREVRQKV